MLVASLKDVIRNQSKEIDTLRAQIQELTATAQKPNEVPFSQLISVVNSHWTTL